MALSDEEIETIAARVIEIAEARRADELEKLEAERPDRELKGLRRRISDLEESRVTWIGLCLVLLAVEVVLGLALRRDA